jgi:predicted DsbA family dithiol-disulfide isomerase
VSLANRMALASPLIRAVSIEANEFPRLSNQFRVRGVPHTVINRRAAVVGALPEREFVAAVLEGAGVDLEEPPEASSGPTTDINA